MSKTKKGIPENIYIDGEFGFQDSNFFTFDKIHTPEVFMEEVGEDEVDVYEYKLVGKKRLVRSVKVDIKDVKK